MPESRHDSAFLATNYVDSLLLIKHVDVFCWPRTWVTSAVLDIPDLLNSCVNVLENMGFRRTSVSE